MSEFTVEAPERLDKFLVRVMPEHSRSKLAEMATAGKVLVDGKPEKPSFQLKPGMVVKSGEPVPSHVHDLSPADIPIDIIFEDEAFLVVNKPRGLAVHPAASLKEPSLVNALLWRTTLSTVGESFRPGIVHRLDKETTGLLIVAKTDAAHVKLAKQIESKTAIRRYAAVVAGDMDHPSFTINAPMGRDKQNRVKMTVDPDGKPAVTHVKQVARLEQGALIAVSLETGRTHQIRVHLLSIKHPVLGDSLYAPRVYRSVPLQLHAAYLSLIHPVSRKRVSFYAPPPPDFLGADFLSEPIFSDF